ncbi:MAG: hypothetical protein V4708_09960 [Bacteroidota bacterium]
MVRNNDSQIALTQFKIFTVLWSVATLFHMAYAGVFEEKLNYALLTLAALYVIFKPGNVKGFFILMLLQLYDVFFLLPEVNNHWLFTAFVNLTIIQALIYQLIKQKSFYIDRSRWFELFAPILRFEVLILYFFAVFHKLNSDFLDPQVSCASVLLEAQNKFNWPIRSELFALAGYFTLVIETIIPLLLCFKKTRKSGILIGVLFHSVLAYSSYNGYFDFSSMMFALYFLFADRPLSFFIAQKYSQLKSVQLFESFSFTKLAVTFFTIVVSLGFLHFLVRLFPEFPDFNLYIFWLTYNLVFLYLFVKYYMMKPESESTRYFSTPAIAFLIMPIMVFINGMSPYLGLKTESSYSMFSNLRTEGGVSNHYLIPANYQIFNFQKEYVELISSSDAFLQKAANEKSRMVLFHFHRYLLAKKPAKVEYLLNGKKEVYVASGTGTTRPIPKDFYLFTKLFNFRLYKDGPQPCGH